MAAVVQIFFVLSALMFIGMIRYIVAIKKPGVYPPKKLLRKRASALAVGGMIVLLFGMIFKVFI